MIARLLALLALLIAVPAKAQADGRLVEWRDVASAFVDARNVTIWLPPGYDHGHRRYPVIYMHDGQNVFVPGHAYGGQEWGVDEAMSRMIAAGRTHGAIIVGIWNNGAMRGREYLPGGPVLALSPAVRAQVEATHGGPSRAAAYLRFIVDELKPRVDRTFRTRRGRADTSTMGSSMGGLIALAALVDYPDVFGAAAGVSIHWPLGDPRPGEGADAASIAAAFRAWFAASAVNPARNRLYTDHGDQTLDAYYGPYADAMQPVLRARGWRAGRNWQARDFPGAAHNEASWRARVAVPLAFLLGIPDD